MDWKRERAELEALILRQARRLKELRGLLVEEAEQRRQAERERDESRTRCHALAAATSEGIALHADGEILECNPSFAEIFGYPRERLHGFDAFQLVAPADRPLARQRIQVGDERPYAISGLRHDGAEFPMQLSVRNLEHDGRRQRIVAVRDLTEIEESRRSLVESETRLRQLFHALPAGLVLVEADTHRIAEANPAACQMIGADRDAVLGQVCHNFICPRSRGDCPISDHGKTVENAERELLCADGGVRPVAKTVVPLTLGGTRYLLESFLDISPLKQTQAELAESEQRFRMITQAAKDAVVTMDSEGRVESWNPAAAELFDVPAAEALGQGFHDLIAPEVYQGGGGAGELQESGGSTSLVGDAMEVVARRRDGRTLTVELTMSVARYGGESHVICIARDLAARKAAEVALERAATRDGLTGLYNRAAFDAALAAVAPGATLSMMVCDVDGLKTINDTQGHEAGDALIRAAAGVLADCFRADDMVCRLGGDEFAVLLPGVDEATVARLRERVLAAVERVESARPGGAALSMSVGVSTGAADDVVALFNAADQAMYAHKVSRRGTVRSRLRACV